MVASVWPWSSALLRIVLLRPAGVGERQGANGHMSPGAVQETVIGTCTSRERALRQRRSRGHDDCRLGADPVRDSDWDAVCVRTAIAVGAEPAALLRRCRPLPAVPRRPCRRSSGDARHGRARASARIDLPASELQIQPPHGRTLVNFDTNFYTEQPAFDRTVELLGRQVDLRIWPSQFRWVFGDGAELASQSAGAPYPDLLITHSYLQKGGVSPRVDTTYAASFRVDGGAWRDVDGTVTIPGAPVPLEVVTARPVLVSGD